MGPEVLAGAPKRIYDYPTDAALQPLFLREYLAQIERRRESALATQAPDREESWRKYAAKDPESYEFMMEEYAKNCELPDWPHIVKWPWSKSTEYGQHVLLNPGKPIAERGQIIVERMAERIVRMFRVLWWHKGMRAVYRWPRIITVDNYKGDGPAVAWHARVVPA